MAKRIVVVDTGRKDLGRLGTSKAKSLFEVVKAFNVIDPKVGSLINEDEIQSIITRGIIDVEINAKSK